MQVDLSSFQRLIQAAQQQGCLAELLTFFLTFEEQEQLQKRLVLTRELLKGELSQRAISDEYDISISKITRGSNALKTIPTTFKQFLIEHLGGAQ